MTKINLYSASVWRRCAPWIIGIASACLLVFIPTPLTSVFQAPYERLLSTTVAYCFDQFGIPFHRDGSAFSFASFELSVSNFLAQFGFFSALLVTCSLALTWVNRPAILAPVYTAATLVGSFGVHLIQLCLIGLTQQVWHIDFASGWLSIQLMIATLPVAILFAFSSDRFIQVVFMPIPLELSFQTQSNPLIHAWNSLLQSLTAAPAKKEASQ